MENIPEALKLLTVGMLTVFTILLIVIYLGKGLIAFINRFAPEEVKDVKTAKVVQTSVDANTTAIINETVKQITAGKGRAINIRKL